MINDGRFILHEITCGMQLSIFNTKSRVLICIIILDLKWQCVIIRASNILYKDCLKKDRIELPTTKLFQTDQA